MSHRLFALFLLIIALALPLKGADLAFDSEGDYLLKLDVDDIRMADKPISYGEAGFRQRILERTGGVRDPVGLVLTGGSARAFAHIGVIKYLEENEIEPDFIVANSMGSIIGLFYAYGLSADQILKVITSGELSAFFNLTIPTDGGLLDTKGFKGLATSIVGSDLDINELPIPVMIVSQDLVTKREVRIMEGNFADVLIASFAIPAYFSPIEYRGHLLVDGGIISLAPIAVAYDYSDTVIVSTTFYDNKDINLKNLISIINVAYDVGKRRNAATEIRKYRNDMIWIRCEVEQFSFMDFSEAEELAQIGYESASQMADELNKLYKHPIEAELLQVREESQKQIEKAVRNLRDFGRIEYSTPSSSFSLGTYSYLGSEYPYYLKPTFDLGLEYDFSYNFIETSVFGGGAIDLARSGDMNAYPIVALNLGMYITPNLRFTLFGSTMFSKEPKWYIPSFYARQGFDAVFVPCEGLRVVLSEAVEYNNTITTKDEDDQFIVSARVSSSYTSKYFVLNSYVGYAFNLLEDLETRHYLDFKLGARVYFSDKLKFFLSFSTMARYSFGGGVQLFASDNFLTNNEDLLSMNKTGYAGTLDSAYIVIAPVKIGYRFAHDPAFGEIMMFESLDLSAYCDFLFTEAYNLAFSTGLEAQFNISFLGLMKVPFNIRLGYDSLSNNVICGIRFSLYT